MMKELYTTKSEELKNEYTEQEKIASFEPTNLSEFSEHVNNLAEVRKEKDLLTDKFKQIDRMYDLLLHYGVDLLPSERMYLSSLKKVKKCLNDFHTAVSVLQG